MPYRDRGKWRGVVKIRGKRYTESFLTKREALAWESKTRQELKSKPVQTQTATGFLTLYNKYLDYAKARYSKKTYDEKVILAKRFILFFGDHDIFKITPSVIQEFILSTARSKTNNRANRDRKNMLSFFNWLNRIHGLQHNPVAGIDRLPHDRQVQYVPLETDILQVLMAADKRERAFPNCYLQTAARRSSVFRWKWGEDVDFVGRRVRVWSRKNRDGSLDYIWLPMTNELHDDLQWWYRNRTHRESEYVWTVPEGPYAGQPYTFRHKFLKGLCRRAGVKPFAFHALRRYAATKLASQGVPMKTIQRVLGHKSLSTTERYLGRADEDLRSAMELLSSKSTTTEYHAKKKDSSADA